MLKVEYRRAEETRRRSRLLAYGASGIQLTTVQQREEPQTLSVRE